MRTSSLAEAKTNFSDLVENLTRTREVIAITKHGVPAAVLLSAEEFASLIETIAWMQEPGMLADLAQARDDISAQNTISLKEITRILDR